MPEWSDEGVPEWKQDAEPFQQAVGILLCDRHWDRFLKHEQDFLAMEVGYALFGPPSSLPENCPDGLYGYTKDQTRNIKKISEILVKKGTERSDTLLFAKLFVSCKTDDKSFQAPVFRIAKDSRGDVNDAYFIDSACRVYKGWADYLKSNQLPKCLCIYPEKEVYEEDDDGLIKLSEGKSPACSMVNDIVDGGTLILDVTGKTIQLLALAHPIPRAIVFAGRLAASVSSIAEFIQAVYKLFDKNQREQSVNPFRDAEAFRCWLSVMGIGWDPVSGRASRVASKMAAGGDTVGRVGRFAVKALKITSLSIQGVRLLSDFYFLAKKEIKEGPDAVSDLEIYQLVLSTFFFHHALMDATTAKTIIREFQSKTDQDNSKGSQGEAAKTEFSIVERKPRAKDGKSTQIRPLKNIKTSEDFTSLLLLPEYKGNGDDDSDDDERRGGQ